MKISLIIAAILVVSLLIGSFAIAQASPSQEADEEPVEEVTCSGCQGSCSGQQNCGLESCGALQGESCGCKR